MAGSHSIEAGLPNCYTARFLVNASEPDRDKTPKLLCRPLVCLRIELAQSRIATGTKLKSEWERRARPANLCFAVLFGFCLVPRVSSPGCVTGALAGVRQITPPPSTSSTQTSSCGDLFMGQLLKTFSSPPLKPWPKRGERRMIWKAWQRASSAGKTALTPLHRKPSMRRVRCAVWIGRRYMRRSSTSRRNRS